MAKKEAQKTAITDTDEAIPLASSDAEQGAEQSPPAPDASASELPSGDLTPPSEAELEAERAAAEAALAAEAARIAAEADAAKAASEEAAKAAAEAAALAAAASEEPRARPTFDELRAAYAENPDLVLEARLLHSGPELRAGIVVTNTRWSRFTLRSVFELSMSHVQALAHDPDIEVRAAAPEA